MILKIKLGAGTGLRLDQYVTGKPGAVILATNMAGKTPRERAAELAGLRSAKPDLQKTNGHLVLSHDPLLPDLTPDQWRTAIDIARDAHDMRDAPFCAVLHVDSDHRHVHVFFLRIRPGDNSVVSDSHSFRKNETGARRIERELGLPAPTPVPKKDKVGDRRAVENATRRGRRKQQTKGEKFMEVTELRARIDHALAESDSVDKFGVQLAIEGIEARWSANLSGIEYKPREASTWLKGSSVRRDLSARGVMLVLERNASLRAAAKESATAAVAVADDRAQASADARLARNEDLDDVTAAPSVPSRALPAAEADAARALAQAGPDPLSFFVPPEIVPPVLDDVAVTTTPPTPTVASAPTESEEDADVRRDRAEAQAQLSARYRKLSAAQLVELREAAKRPVDEVLITLALLERLLALALKILSLGAIKIATNVASALQQRELIAQAADDELARRRRSPATADERLSELAEQEKAMRGRTGQLQDRKLANEVLRVFPRPKVYFEGQETTELARELDESRSREGKPTTIELTKLQRKLELELAELSVAEPKPIGVLSRLNLNPAARAAFEAEAEYQAWKAKQERAKRLRQLTADRLAQFLREIEQEVAAREAQREATERVQLKILNDEREALEIEVRDRVPGRRREAQSAEPQQQQQYRPAPQTDAEAEDAAAAEREALRRLGRLG